MTRWLQALAFIAVAAGLIALAAVVVPRVHSSGVGSQFDPPRSATVTAQAATRRRDPIAALDRDVITRNPLHAAHLGGGQPVDCAGCHEIQPGGFSRPSDETCARCHQVVHGPKAHAEVECISCHEFAASNQTTARVKPCVGCHQVEVHARETCTDCHQAHEGGQSVRPCESCHTDLHARHGGRPAGACLDCHRPHQKAKVAAAKSCASCHTDRPRALFRGHDRCVGCHLPHQFVRAAARSCQSCHAGQVTLAAERVPQHQACTSCHQPHDATRDAAGACATCHKLGVGHPADARGRACLGCHDVHPERGKVTRAACSSCHRDATSDTALHAGGIACTACHTPHRFAALAGSASCATCHQEKARATVRAGHHQDCRACHDQHRPAASRPACATCHAAEAQTAPAGHARCETCHAPHFDKPNRGSDCGSCHKVERASAHGAVPGGGCVSCHRPHGPAGQARPPACTTCHAVAKLPSLHQVPRHQDCARCHGAHRAVRGDRVTCLGCHKDRVDHEPLATSCIGCHAFGGGP